MINKRNSLEEYFEELISSFLSLQRLVLFFLLLLFLFSFYLYHLTIIPVFADEAIYIRWAQLIKNVATLRFVPLQDGKQPLFMWLLVGLLKLKQDPLFSGRFLSVLFGLASAFVLSLLFNHLLTPKGKFRFSNFIMAFLFLPLLPFAFFFSRLALVDMALSFFFSLGVYLFLLYWQYPRLDLVIISAFVVGLAWLTKSPGMFLFLISLFWLVVKILRTKNLKIIGHFLAFVVVVELTYGILRLSPNYHMIAMRNKDYLFPLSKFLHTPLDPFLPHLKDTFWFYWFYFTPVGLLYLISGFLIFLKSGYLKIDRFLISLSFTLVPFLFSLVFAKVFTARYLLYFSLPLTFFIFFLFQQLRKKLLWIFFVSLLLFSLGYDLSLAIKPTRSLLPTEEYRGYLTDWTAGWGIKESAKFFANQAKNNKIVVGTEGYFGTLPDGLWIYLDGTPNLTIIGGPVPVKEIPSSLLNSAKAGNLTYLVANKSRFLIPPTVAQNRLKLIRSYPKPPDPLTGISDSLNIWRVQP